jgi:hypothetical protein
VSYDAQTLPQAIAQLDRAIEEQIRARMLTTFATLTPNLLLLIKALFDKG